MSLKTHNFNITLCDTFFKQGTGLTFTFPRKPFAYIFVFKKPVNLAITMWFVFYPIDIVFLDSNGHVVELVKSLKPFTNYFPKANFTYFIEFSKGTLDSLDISSKSIISWSASSISVQNI